MTVEPSVESEVRSRGIAVATSQRRRRGVRRVVLASAIVAAIVTVAEARRKALGPSHAELSFTGAGISRVDGAVVEKRVVLLQPGAHEVQGGYHETLPHWRLGYMTLVQGDCDSLSFVAEPGRRYALRTFARYVAGMPGYGAGSTAPVCVMCWIADVTDKKASRSVASSTPCW